MLETVIPLLFNEILILSGIVCVLRLVFFKKGRIFFIVAGIVSWTIWLINHIYSIYFDWNYSIYDTVKEIALLFLGRIPEIIIVSLIFNIVCSLLYREERKKYNNFIIISIALFVLYWIILAFICGITGRFI